MDIRSDPLPTLYTAVSLLSGAVIARNYRSQRSVPLGLFVGVATSSFICVELRTSVRRVVLVGVVRRRPHSCQRNLFRVRHRLAQTVAVPRRPSQTLGPSRLSRQHGQHLYQLLGSTRATTHLSVTHTGDV